MRIKKLTENGNPDSEMYFFKCESFSKGFFEFKCLICFEIGKKLYLEKQFHFSYKFQILKGPKKFEDFIMEHLIESEQFIE
jgi:hypothetical protein